MLHETWRVKGDPGKKRREPMYIPSPQIKVSEDIVIRAFLGSLICGSQL